MIASRFTILLVQPIEKWQERQTLMRPERTNKIHLNRKAGALASFFILGTLAATLFQNCGDGFAVKAQLNSTTLLSGSQSNVATGPADTLLTSCLDATQYDACVFLKNPVAQESSPEGNPWYSSIPARQRYAVKLNGLLNTGNLDHSSFQVQGAGGVSNTLTRATRSTTTQWRTSIDSESSVSLKGFYAVQVSAYYWLSRFLQSLESSPLIGNAHTNARNVQIQPYATTVEGQAFRNAAYYQGGTLSNKIILGYSFNNTPLAFSGDILIHEFTHALVFHANNDTANAVTTTHRYCLDQVTTLSADQQAASGICCKTTAGCMKAMNEGLADYFASVQFPSNPVIGEGMMNAVGGLTTCGTNTPQRDVTKNASRTPASVFSLCKASVTVGGTVTTADRNGEQYTMASVYTSILWEIRKKVNTAIPQITVAGVKLTGAQFFDAIVHEHLVGLTGSSTFASSRAALKDSASALVGLGQIVLPSGVNLSTLIDSEFTARGI